MSGKASQEKNQNSLARPHNYLDYIWIFKWYIKVQWYKHDKISNELHVDEPE